ncbi:hypothetical protein [Mycoplasma bradburyae]|uniref:hypothetical protein n=1 Tax=Mycoplasma bradburyae TaxID=2963128 RepID=UPI0020CD4D8D|nr:hypothetical protein [Mycoplasma bradburyae]UTS70564.1 hypothetical protein NMG77_02305 [Mycoplasma bradburyae]
MSKRKKKKLAKLLLKNNNEYNKQHHNNPKPKQETNQNDSVILQAETKLKDPVELELKELKKNEVIEDSETEKINKKLTKKRKRKNPTKAPDITIRIGDQYLYDAYDNWKRNLKRNNSKAIINDELNRCIRSFLLNENKKLEYAWLDENQERIMKLFKEMWLEQNKFYWDRFNELIEIMYSEVAATKLLTIYLINNIVDKKQRSLLVPSNLELNDEWLKKYIETKIKYKSKNIK